MEMKLDLDFGIEPKKDGSLGIKADISKQKTAAGKPKKKVYAKTTDELVKQAVPPIAKHKFSNKQSFDNLFSALSLKYTEVLEDPSKTIEFSEVFVKTTNLLMQEKDAGALNQVLSIKAIKLFYDSLTQYAGHVSYDDRGELKDTSSSEESLRISKASSSIGGLL